MNGVVPLARPGKDLSIEARADALYAATTRPGIRLSRLGEWPAEWFDSPPALQAALQLAHLVELGLAEEDAGSLRVPYARFPALLAQGFTLPLLWSGWSPFTLSIRTHGTLAEDGLRFSARFRLGDMDVEIERAGRYVRRLGHPQTWLLDDLAFALLERLESPCGGEARWIDFGFVKAYASELCADMDAYLQRNDVLFPAALRTATASAGVYGRLEPVLDEVPEELFRRTFRSVANVERRLSVLPPTGAWTHLFFDDGQLEFLRLLKSGVAHLAPVEAVAAGAGRVGSRQALIESRREVVPVRLRAQLRILEGLPASSGGHALYDREIQAMPRGRLEALVASLYAASGFRVILAAEGCGAGASVIAVRDGIACLVRVETAQAGLDSLDAVARMRAAYRRLHEHPYRLALVVRNGCTRELMSRALAARVDLKDSVHLIDEVESIPVASGDVAAAERCRCQSLLAVVECLRSLLGD